MNRCLLLKIQVPKVTLTIISRYKQIEFCSPLPQEIRAERQNTQNHQTYLHIQPAQTGQISMAYGRSFKIFRYVVVTLRLPLNQVITGLGIPNASQLKLTFSPVAILSWEIGWI